MSLKNRYAALKHLNAEAIYNTFLGLQPKEQIVALVVTGVVALLIIILPISLASSKISGLEKSISTGRDKINDVARELEEYNKAKSRLNSVEGQLRSGFDTSIATTIENFASQSGMKDNVDSIKEKAAVPSEIYDEAAVDVRISRVTLGQLVDFLYKIESDKSRVLRIKQLQIKPRYDNRSLVDVSFQVSTFKLSGEGA